MAEKKSKAVKELGEPVCAKDFEVVEEFNEVTSVPDLFGLFRYTRSVLNEQYNLYAKFKDNADLRKVIFVNIEFYTAYLNNLANKLRDSLVVPTTTKK